MSSLLRSRWALLHEGSSFLKPPHETLYPAVWGEDEQMLPEAHEAFMGAFLDVVSPDFPDVLEWTRYALIGSGACYNWDEEGDLDLQVWVQDESKVRPLRRLIVANLLGLTCADLGLDGVMEVQWYAKPGQGTVQDNLDGQPYACYDMDANEWLVKPFPMTPQFYAELFLLVEGHAAEVAAEAETLLGRYHRAQEDVAYWTVLPGYEERATKAVETLREAQADVRALFNQLKGSRSKAYTAEGQGIRDERDALWKLLEVWGVRQRLQDVSQEQVA